MSSLDDALTILFCLCYCLLGENFPQGYKQDHELQKMVDFIHWDRSKRLVVSNPAKTPNTPTQQPEEQLIVPQLYTADPTKKKSAPTI